MDLRTYRAKSLPEALRLVRAELGDDASVLHTREVRSGLLRWFGRTEIEVTASNEVEVPSRMPLANRISVAREEAIPEPAYEHNSTANAAPAEATDYRLRFRELLHQDNDESYSVVDSLSRAGDAKSPAGSKVIATLRGQLHAAGVDDVTSAAWLAQLDSITGPELSLRDAQDQLLRIVEAEIPLNGPIQVVPSERRVVALVGPTGVGKTTTIAKLAAAYRLQKQCRVGLITLDTFRIAAVDQLKTYADIMSLPLEIAATPAEMSRALSALSDCQLVLIDTTGRSPRDAMRIAEQRSLLAVADPDEVHLVLSAASSIACQQLAMRAYAGVNPTALVLTKLDELLQAGSLASLLRETSLPLSYTTHGQNVPDDIRVVERRQLARCFTGLSTTEMI